MNLRDHERECLADLRHQIVRLPHARKVLVVGAILRQLQGSEVVKPLQFEIERLLKFQTLGQSFRGSAQFSFPFLDPRIGFLDPGKIFLPFVDAGEKMSQVPFIGLRDFGACCNCGRHSTNVQRPTLNVQRRMQMDD